MAGLHAHLPVRGELIRQVLTVSHGSEGYLLDQLLKFYISGDEICLAVYLWGCMDIAVLLLVLTVSKLT